MGAGKRENGDQPLNGDLDFLREEWKHFGIQSLGKVPNAPNRLLYSFPRRIFLFYFYVIFSFFGGPHGNGSSQARD